MTYSVDVPERYTGKHPKGGTAMTTISTNDEVRNMIDIYDGFIQTAKTAPKDTVERCGKTMAMVLQGGHSTSPNFHAQLLEDFRAIYASRFCPKAEPVSPSAPTTAAPAPKPAVFVPRDLSKYVGTYTVVFSENQYETIKIERVKNGALAGRYIASFLSGPDNELDFQGFAFVNEYGDVHTWKKYNNLEGGLKYRAVQIILQDIDGAKEKGQEAYAMRSGRCSRCGRKLTVPASLHRGLGPDCAGMI